MYGGYFLRLDFWTLQNGLNFLSEIKFGRKLLQVLHKNNQREWNVKKIENWLNWSQNINAPNPHAYDYHICREWYNSSCPMIAKPMKTLKFRYLMMQFWIVHIWLTSQLLVITLGLVFSDDVNSISFSPCSLIVLSLSSSQACEL